MNTLRTIFAPPLDSVWRLTEDWKPDAPFISRTHGAGDNSQTLGLFDVDVSVRAWPAYEGTGPHKVAPLGWWTDQRRAQYMAWQAEVIDKADVVFPAGTILTFDRYHISHSGDHIITLRVLLSPDTRLTPKKRGGKMKGPGRIYFKVEELNTLPPVEEVPGGID